LAHLFAICADGRVTNYLINCYAADAIFTLSWPLIVLTGDGSVGAEPAVWPWPCFIFGLLWTTLFLF